MIDELLTRYPALRVCEEDIRRALGVLTALYESDGTLLLCGNGGSAADCEHIVGELAKGFLKKRPLPDSLKELMQSTCPDLTDDTLSRLQLGLSAISLPSIAGLNSAFSNDVAPDLIYAQSVLALGKTDDCLLAISTSGNSKNVVEAARVARGMGMCVIALTGEGGGRLRELANVCICAPERETYRVQELHLPIYHALCAALEEHFFG